MELSVIEWVTVFAVLAYLSLTETNFLEFLVLLSCRFQQVVSSLPARLKFTRLYIWLVSTVNSHINASKVRKMLRDRDDQV